MMMRLPENWCELLTPTDSGATVKQLPAFPIERFWRLREGNPEEAQKALAD
jgi:hypothetical protein